MKEKETIEQSHQDELEPTVAKLNPHQLELAKGQVNKTAKKFPIVGIGASAGGLVALESFFRNVPADSGLAYVVVTHLDPNQKDMMAEIIQRFTGMQVLQITDGIKVEPNKVYIIPPNNDLTILQGTLLLLEPVKKKGLRMPIDIFFQSLAKDQRENAICIILSGMGSDGTIGLKMIMENFGMVMVQDPVTAEFDAMPQSAIQTDFVDYILPPQEMPARLLAYVNQPVNKRNRDLHAASKPTHALEKIYVLIRAQTGHDFSLYKRNTVFRRIERRMASHQIAQFGQYVRYLQENPLEVELLFKELLIGVTKFFRDQEAFQVLKDTYLPQLISRKSQDKTIRVWVAGCSTGEEAYSIAILLLECLEKVKDRHLYNIQIFASDIDKVAIDRARNATYQENIIADVSPERLQKYFKKIGNSYQVKNKVRELVVFAVHNLTKDAPFTKLDLLCCRNLLIYLSAELQRRLIPVFHYSLIPGGLLFLGSSETISGFNELFEPLDTKWKISMRTKSVYPLSRIIDFPFAHTNIEPNQISTANVKNIRDTTVPAIVQKMLLEQYVPPSVIINLKGDIFYINGRTGKYLEPAPGQASLNIFDMAREGLKLELNSCVYKASSHNEPVTVEPVIIKNEQGEQPIRLTVNPLCEPEQLKGLLLVVFEDIVLSETAKPGKHRKKSSKENTYVAELEKELHFTKQRLQGTIEEMQSSLEELKSTNEELQSANEELQSTNEEFMTNKEELQSLNEELMTINAQYQTKTDELSQRNNDMKNLLDSTEIGTIFLDNNLKVKNFTPQATQIFNLIQSDIGRPIAHISSNLRYENLANDVAEVIDRLITKEIELKTVDNESWYYMHILPYRTADNFIDGVVITFSNVTKFKKLEQELKDAWEFANNIINAVRDPLVVLDGNLRVSAISKSFSDTFHVIPEQTKGQLLYHLGNGQWNIPELRNLMDEILNTDQPFNDYFVEYDFPVIGHRKMLLNARKIMQRTNNKPLILLGIQDITNK
jgi:two-component system CheB/CheR fusion protein